MLTCFSRFKIIFSEEMKFCINKRDVKFFCMIVFFSPTYNYRGKPTKKIIENFLKSFYKKCKNILWIKRFSRKICKVIFDILKTVEKNFEENFLKIFDKL